MYNLHGSLVLLVYTVLVFFLHVFVQDIVEGSRLDAIEQLLEPELLLLRYDIADTIGRC